MSRVVWAGRYAVFDEIAAGGMASVYLACRLEQSDAPRVVAIKKMFESFAKQPEFVTMFLDEAHIAARIRHPNVVTTYEFLRIPDSLGIVMEFVLGVSMVDLLRIARDREVKVPLGVASAVLRDTLAGIHAAHETKDEKGDLVGLVHRDVSPHNILVGKDGAARVIDFGIAKAAGRLQVTDVGVMKGKFAYMAPEQIRAGPVDRRVDVYSAGIVLWETVTGAPLFRGSADAELFSRRGSGGVTAPPASSLRKDVPPELDEVIEGALHVDPADRFATALEMSNLLVKAIPPASSTAVAEWVLRLAGSRLKELEAKRNEVETAFAAGELVGLSPTQVSPRGVAPAAPPAAAPLELDIPELAPRPPPSVPVKPAPPPRRSAPPEDLGKLDDAFSDSAGGEVALDLAMPAMVRPAVSSSLDARFTRASSHSLGAYEGARKSRGRKRSGAGLGVLLLLLAAAGAAYVLGPGYVKAAVVAAAARRGVVLSADGIEPRSGGFVLSGVTMTLAGVDGLVAKAAEVSVDLDWQGTPHHVLVPGYELTVQGGATQIAGRFAAWRSSPHLPPVFDAKAGHLVWTDVLAPGVKAEGIDVSIQAGSTDDGSLAVEVPSLTVTFVRASLGPWRAHLGSTAGETKLGVYLDRSKQEGPPSVVVVSRPALGTVVTATVPRTKAVQIGVPADFFLAGSDAEVDLSLEAQVMPTGQPLTAHAAVALFGAAAGAAPPTDLLIEGSVQGDSSRPLRIDPGTLTLGKAKTKLTGVLTFSPDGARVEVDRPAGRAPVAPPPFVVDTHDWMLPADTAPPKATPPPPPVASSAARSHR